MKKMYYIRYVHQLTKQPNPVLIKIAIHYLNLYDWLLKEIISAIEKLVTKMEKSFSSGRSCRPHKITVDYNYTLIWNILLGSRQKVNRKKTSSNIYFPDTKNTILQPISCCEKIFKAWVFCFLGCFDFWVFFLRGRWCCFVGLGVFLFVWSFFANLLFHLSSYLYQLSCLKKKINPILAECLELT